MPDRAPPLLTRSPGETFAWARDFARGLKTGEAVGLRGELGAGKTVVAQGIAAGLGYTGAVVSPSYALVNEYRGPVPVFHLDLYRLGERADWEEIGLAHYLAGDGVCLIEWPERLGEGIAALDWQIAIGHGEGDEREIRVTRRP